MLETRWKLSTAFNNKQAAVCNVHVKRTKEEERAQGAWVIFELLIFDFACVSSVLACEC